MDIKSLYELAEKPLPDSLKDGKASKFGACPHDKISGGDGAFQSNLLNINDKKELSPAF